MNELAPIFAKFSTEDGFDKVMQVLESKENQIEKVMGGEWNKETDLESQDEQNNQEEQQTTTLTAEQILEQKYNGDK